MRIVCALVLAFVMYLPVLAQPPSETEIEKRAREVGQSLRCVVCQNQSIDESDASLAQDMRKLVRARIRQGDSNEEVMAFMQNRYGDFVLLKPPVQTNTYLLWYAPAILLALFLLWYVVRVRRKPVMVEAAPLSTKELRQFEKLSAEQETSEQEPNKQENTL